MFWSKGGGGGRRGLTHAEKQLHWYHFKLKRKKLYWRTQKDRIRLSMRIWHKCLFTLLVKCIDRTLILRPDLLCQLHTKLVISTTLLYIKLFLWLPNDQVKVKQVSELPFHLHTLAFKITTTDMLKKQTPILMDLLSFHHEWNRKQPCWQQFCNTVVIHLIKKLIGTSEKETVQVINGWSFEHVSYYYYFFVEYGWVKW